MQEPPWMPRTEEEYRQQVAEDAGPQPDEMVRLQQALDAAEEEVARLQMVRDAAERKIAELLSVLADVANVSEARGICWCPESKPAEADHMPACRRARKAFTD